MKQVRLTAGYFSAPRRSQAERRILSVAADILGAEERRDHLSLRDGFAYHFLVDFLVEQFDLFVIGKSFLLFFTEANEFLRARFHKYD